MLNEEKINRLKQMENIANAIAEEFNRKEIPLPDGIGGCLMLLAKYITATEDPKESKFYTIQSLECLIHAFELIDETQP